MKIEQVAEQILGDVKPGRTALISIDGFGGSGKTTLAEVLRDLLMNAYVVHMDDFIVKEKLDEPSWSKGAFDRNRLESQVLRPIAEGRSARYQKLIWDTNTLSDLISVPEVDFVIVEGISTSHPDIAEYFTYKMWVDVPIETAKERGHARDGANENAHYWDIWTANDINYLEMFKPDEAADFVVEN